MVRPGLAADASPWDGGTNAAVRLIAGATPQRAGVEIRLAPGWKTYWRYPGDSGVPPRFDFSGSLNAKSVIVRWPAPQGLKDETGISIGYKHDVVLLLDVVPRNANKPVTLRLKIDYAVCERICVPADGKAELTLDGAPGALAERVSASDAKVPKPAAIGDNGPLSIRAVRREGAKVIVDVAAPTAAELFAEGPTPDWALPVPARVADPAPGLQRFTFELGGLPPKTKPDGAIDGAMLLLTAVAGEHAIEVPFRLDSPN